MKAVIALALAFVVSVSASPATREEQDWKFTHGWDGTVLPATAIGIPVIDASTNHTSSSLDARAAQAIGGVFICSDTNWKGRCGYAVQPLNTCIKLGSDWKDQISSFGPDKCTQCKGWVNDHCEDFHYPGGSAVFWGYWTFNNPGDATGGIGTFEPWNDRIESFKCTQTC